MTPDVQRWDMRPYVKLSVGLEELFDELTRMTSTAPETNYPPYNIVKYNDDTYSIELAVAGFEMSEIDINLENNHLVVQGIHAEKPALELTYIHRGISSRNFTKTITLGNHIVVNGASLKNGMLTISLVRVLPENLKPRKILITSDE